MREARESTQLWRDLMRRIAPSFLWACVLVASGELIARPSLAPDAPRTIHPLIAELSPGSYDGFVNTAAQVGATLLALYFATVGVVASTAYARGPHRIRILFVRERAGRFYTKSVALLVSSSLLVIGLGQLGVEVHAVTVLLLVGVAVFSVLSLVELGVTIFNFFDPSSLAGPLVGDFVRWSAAAGSRGRLGSDPSFQAHYQDRADAALQSLSELLDLVDSMDRVDPDRVAALARQACHMLSLNARAKTAVPTTSWWYPRRLHHPSWFTASDSERSMAITTSTALRAAEVPDHDWVERSLTEVIVRALRTLISSSDLARAVGVLQSLGGPIRFMSGELQAREALEVCRAVCNVVWDRLEVQADAEGEPTLELAALVDVGIVMLVNVGLGLQDRLGAIEVDAFSRSIDDALHRRGGVYDLRMPIRVLKSLEEMDRGVRFERDAEGRQVTPAWFPRQIAGRALINLITEDVDAVVKELATVVSKTTDLASRDKSIVAASAAYRALELAHRTSGQALRFRQRLSDLSALRQVHDEYWPALPAEGWPTDVKGHERVLCALVAHLLSPLGSLTKTDPDPDWFGQAYALIVSRLFAALEDGDEEFFAAVFPLFFDAAFRARDRLALEMEGRPAQTVIAYVTEPLADLLEISGYALLFSELDEKSFWTQCRSKWDEYLSDGTNAHVVTVLGLTPHVRQGIFAIKPRDLERGGRKQRFDALLRDRGIEDTDSSGPFFHHEPEPPSHASPIIRAFAPYDLGGFEDPEDLFVVEYLKNRAEWSGDLTSRASSLQWQITRERGEEPA